MQFLLAIGLGITFLAQARKAEGHEELHKRHRHPVRARQLTGRHRGGLATFGTCTDSTSANTAVQSGTFSIDVGVPGCPSAIPVSTANVLPGDSLTRA